MRYMMITVKVEVDDDTNKQEVQDKTGVLFQCTEIMDAISIEVE